MKNLTVYKFGFNHYFINNETKEEGKIILGSGNHGGERYAYVSHLEECEDIHEDRQDQIVLYLEDHFELITNAKNL